MPGRDGVVARMARLSDAPRISEIHQGEDDPWADVAHCAVWTNHRLLRGFLIHVVEYDGRLLGHAEWIVSDDPAPFGRHLYLGMIQIHPASRGQGIGRKMLEAGELAARQSACPCIRTIPDHQARGFYAKCGFQLERATKACWMPLRATPLPRGWRLAGSVPRRAAESLPLRVGLDQASGRHMWEIANRPPPLSDETMYHPAALLEDGRAFVQIRYWRSQPDASALAWASETIGIDQLLKPLAHLASRHGRRRLAVCVEQGDEGILTAFPQCELAQTDEIWKREVGK